jgi:hypothetical protein
MTEKPGLAHALAHGPARQQAAPDSRSAVYRRFALWRRLCIRNPVFSTGLNEK